MIKTFARKHTEKFHIAGQPARQFRPFARQAKRKLLMLHAAAEVRDLRSPPGNRLEKLSGDRAGQYSIRINDQWRICFLWEEGGATDVEIYSTH